MIVRALMTAGVLLALAGPVAAADECTRSITKVKEALSEPDKLDTKIETVEANVSADLVRRAVGLFIEQAQADHVAGNDKTCVTRLVAAKKILDLE